MECALFVGHCRNSKLAASKQLKFEYVEWDEKGFTKSIQESIKKNMFVLKGPLASLRSLGSLNPDVQMARELGLFAHVVHVKTLPGVKTRHNNVDMVLIRENTEGEYSGLEHEINVSQRCNKST